MSKNLSELSGRKGVVDNLFEKMGQLASESGTPEKADLDALAKEFLIGKSSTYGTTTFYDFMKPENKGKKVYVCNGSACLCAGTQQEVHDALLKKFKADEIGHMTCLGRCHENGAFHYNGTNYSAKSASEIDNIINTKAPAKDFYNVVSDNPVLTAPYEGFDAHYAFLKDALAKSREAILEEIKTSSIRGRGGAGFPMGFKLESCKKEENDTKFIICNADEGDPGAYSDRYLLEERPHSVLFGMMIAGYVTGATWGIVYIRGEYPESVTIVENAINELRENGYLGENILGKDFSFDLKVIRAQGAYICGEETALINSIEGQRPEVRTRPPFPTTQGLFNKPTVVNNVETLAALHYIIKNGGKAYKALGTEKSAGTKLICCDSFFNNPGIYEVEMGTPLSKVVHEMAGGFKKPVKALHIGGPLGGIVPVDKIKDLNVDFESFAINGFLLGHASVVSIPEDFPMIKYLEHLFEFASFESCGKCFPCRLGTKRAHEMLQKSADSDYKISRELFDDLLSTLQQGSLCAHGGGIPLPAKNALQYFGDELNKHFEK
ncbi:NADH-ubiquinone oxidoreductase-F iron-sulfur binding region domain-containing protein [Fulvivirga lutimaris]|uniref:NADH-ubiquinone oxidoreductase-F iron-sulfur binding region domain-containing protein n=1 Tax=Fulvivirga lutimaris TaxID=1819566 RepID=UPI0012BD46D6|nr:NADH-ubiquinone oxidoreductase-F iron-sulfur binding region domain-containing protein [Fulvivirga lutimaris]MTI40893.1 formate dehydrogenase [Fulvivirga lutimaris]